MDPVSPGIQEQHGETLSKNTKVTKNTKVSQVWWCTPVIPAIGEGEAGESLELGRRKLQ